MKKLLLGFVWILFGILLELAELSSISSCSIPVVSELPCNFLGLIAGFAGLIFAIIGCFEKKQ